MTTPITIEPVTVGDSMAGILVPVPGKDGAGLEPRGLVDYYSNLPTGLGPDDVGQCWLVAETGKAYFWTGTAWPSESGGVQMKGETGAAGRGVVNITGTSTGLTFDMSAAPSQIQVTVPAIQQASASATAAAGSASSALAAKDAAQTAATSASTSAGSASASADAAASSATTAATRVTEAQAAVTQANSYRTDAMSAAVAAQDAVNGIGDSVTQAENSATAAAGSADSANAAAEAASSSASDASDSASSSAASATSAQDSADQAAVSAANAAEAAGTGIPNATVDSKGGIKLAGHLGGTWDAPTVPGLADKAATSHTHAQADVTGLTAALDGKAAASHTHAQSDVAGLSSALSGKADSSHTHGISEVTGLQSALDGKAPVDGNGKVPAANLPSFVDDVVEYSNLAALPATGESGKIYVTQDSNQVYRWSGSAYVVIAASPGSTDSVPEGATNKYYTDARAQAALAASLALKAPLASPALTGSPTAPTPTAGDSSTKLATTAFVSTALGSGGATMSEYSFCLRRDNTATVTTTNDTDLLQLPAGVFDQTEYARFNSRDAVAGDSFVVDSTIGRWKVPVTGNWLIVTRLGLASPSTFENYGIIATSNSETTGYTQLERSTSSTYYDRGIWFSSIVRLAAGTFVQPGLRLNASGIVGGPGITYYKAILLQGQAAPASAYAAAWCGPEVVCNNVALADGYNDAIGGFWVEPGPTGLGILLDAVALRLANYAETIGGTGNLTVQVYLGTPGSEGSVVATFTVAAGQNSYVYSLPSAVSCAPGSVVRFKFTRGSTTVAGPVHVQPRGRYAV